MLRKSILLAISVIVFSYGSFSSAQEIKIASIDTSKILLVHPSFQKAIEKYQAELTVMQQKIREMDEKEQESAQGMMQQRMQELGMQLELEAFQEMRKDVKKIAEKQGYKYVLDINALIVGGKDITEDVLCELRNEEKEPPVKESPSKKKTK